MFTAAVTPLDDYVKALAYSSSLGMFVAGGSDLGSTITVQTSVDDGVTWVARTTPWDGVSVVNRVAWSSDLGLFVAGGSDAPAFCTSVNGTVWTPQTSPVDTFNVSSIVWASSLGLFVASANDFTSPFPWNGYVVTSPDGVTWTTRATIRYVKDISWSPALGRFVLCAYGSNTGPNWTSPDGITWQQQQWGTGVFTPAAAAWVDSIGRFVAVGTDNGIPERLVATSFDGGVTPWVPQTTPFDDGGVNAVGVADDGQALVSGNTSWFTGALMSSPDGMQWRAQPTPFDTPTGYINVMPASATVTVLGGNP